MIKYWFLFFILITFGPSILMAQMFDNSWIFSFHTQPPQYGIPGTKIYFTPEFNFTKDTFGASCRAGCSTLSDQNGELLFFTNGINVYNKDGTIMENGEYINPGSFNDQYSLTGYPVPQGIVILPTPNQPNSYHLFHVGIGSTESYGAPGLKLYFSKVIISPSTSIPKVAKKNTVILSDTLGKDYITATKHANGRDWWLIIPRIASNKYWIYLLDPEGVHLTTEQNIGYIMN